MLCIKYSRRVALNECLLVLCCIVLSAIGNIASMISYRGPYTSVESSKVVSAQNMFDARLWKLRNESRQSYETLSWEWALEVLRPRGAYVPSSDALQNSSSHRVRMACFYQYSTPAYLSVSTIRKDPGRFCGSVVDPRPAARSGVGGWSPSSTCGKTSSVDDSVTGGSGGSPDSPFKNAWVECLARIASSRTARLFSNCFGPAITPSL